MIHKISDNFLSYNMIEIGIITIIGSIILMLYYKLWTTTKYWESKGVPCEKPWIIVGNMSKVILKKQTLGELLTYFYSKAKNERYFGMYYFNQPCIILKDLDLIKQVTIKDFPNFPIRIHTVCQSTDPIISQMLLFLTDEEKWRNVRSTVSPTFTSSKIKTMFDFINTCAINLIKSLEGKNCDVVETRSLFSKYTTDIIGNCCIGIPCNSFQDPSNKFYTFALKAMESVNSIKLFIHDKSPVLAKLLKVRLLSKKDADYWNNFIMGIITSRNNGFYRNDMMQLFLKLKQQHSRNDTNGSNCQLRSVQAQYAITDHDIVCQTLMVLLAGHDTSASALTFATYELAINLEIQTRLQQEIDEVLASCTGGPLCYDKLMQMKYLDAVVSETLRKWPVSTFLNRRSKNQFVIEPATPNEKTLVLESGMNVLIPTFAIHKDPRYYPNPDNFDPDRFYGTNKSNILPFTYFPFGLGPRSCLGTRLAILEMKVLLFHILTKFNIVSVEDTPIPMITKGFLVVEPEKKCCLGFKLR